MKALLTGTLVAVALTGCTAGVANMAAAGATNTPPQGSMPAGASADASASAGADADASGTTKSGQPIWPVNTAKKTTGP